MAGGTSPATAAVAFVAGLYVATKSVVPSTVLVIYGIPGPKYPNDVVSFGRVTSRQDPATMGTNRGREEILTVEVTFSTYRRGGQEQEIAAFERVYELLALIETYCRVTDTTLGGAVRECFLADHESEGETDPRFIAEGRVREMTATFTARVRVTSY